MCDECFLGLELIPEQGEAEESALQGMERGHESEGEGAGREDGADYSVGAVRGPVAARHAPALNFQWQLAAIVTLRRSAS